MPARNISITNENDVWLVSNNQGNISSLVDSIITKARLEQFVLSSQNANLIQRYVKNQALVGITTDVKTVVNQALKEYMHKIDFIANSRSNTGYE